MKKQKKYGLLFALVIGFLAYVVLSWIIPTGSVSSGSYTEGSTAPVGIFGLIYYPVFTLGVFTQYAFVMLAIGGLYGVMVKTGVYGKLVRGLAKKYENNEKLFLILVMCLLTIASSVIGIPYIGYILIPFIIGVLTLLGYNKITCVAATFGSLLIGEIGSTFGLSISGMAKATFGFEISEWILFKLGLLAVVLILFVLYVLGKKETKIEKAEGIKKLVKAIKSKKAKVNEDETSSKDEKTSVLFLEDEVENSKNPISLVILFIVAILIAIIAMYNFETVFDLTFFSDLYEQITNVGINGYPIFENILGLTGAFGSWDSYELAAILVIASCLIAWVYNLKLSEFVDGMVSGAKKMLKPAFYITFANLIFTMMLINYNSGTMVTFLTEKMAGVTEDLNIFSALGTGFVGSLFYNNFNYLINEVGNVFAIHISDNYAVLSFILQGVYGVMMMVLPTSLILVTGLSMMDVSIVDWFKYIWKYVVQILIIVVILSFLVLLLA